jgi:ankyrin repeat protein
MDHVTISGLARGPLGREGDVMSVVPGDHGDRGLRLSKDDATARALIDAIHAGDVDSLRKLLGEHPGLAAARLVDEKGGSGTALHAAADWPGFFPNGPEIVRILIEAGADPSAAVEGSWHAETALHWAASSDDVEVARALIDGGADIEAPGASIAGGSPLDDAVGYGCWHVARLLVERGARVERLWQAAALGMIPRVEELIAGGEPTDQELTDAFWQACHGGQRRMAELLLARGAELNGTPSWGGGTPLDVAEGVGTGREALLTYLRERGARNSTEPAEGGS